MESWRSHFSTVASNLSSSFDQTQFNRIRRRIRRARSQLSPAVFDVPFSVAELLAALRYCHFGKAPGPDNLPYDAFHVDLLWWRQAVLAFLELCRIYACVPSVWKQGVVIPLHKGGESSDLNTYRPITLTCCFAKVLERMILNRVQPVVDPMLDSSQAGYRWGADVQVYALLETLQHRGRSTTFCAFLDLRKAFDVAWRDAALVRLHRAGVTGRIWHLIDDLVSNRTACVRIDGHHSEDWEVEDGIGQGAVLSGLLFNILINSLAASIKRACRGVTVGVGSAIARVQLFCMPMMWSSCVMTHRMCRGHWMLLLSGLGSGGSNSESVKQNPLFCVILHERLSWRPHVQHLLARGEQMPVEWTARLFETYVVSSACYGIEFVTQSSALTLLRSRLLQWGRRILQWPAGAPGAAVLAELGWSDLDARWALRAASLCGRLMHLSGITSRPCLPSVIAAAAVSWPCSWIALTRDRLVSGGSPDASYWGVEPGCTRGLVQQWCERLVAPAVRAASDTRYAQAASAMGSLQNYLALQPQPRLCRAVYGSMATTEGAREWGLARCGHHCFADGRSARHRGASSARICRFCATGSDSLEHALLHCPSCLDLRSRWLDRSSTRVLEREDRVMAMFDTRPSDYTARDVANNIWFVAAVCRRAAACIVALYITIAFWAQFLTTTRCEPPMADIMAEPEAATVDIGADGDTATAGAAQKPAQGKRKRGEGPGGGEVTVKDAVGTVRMFNSDKGWGFIDGDTVGRDIFLHSKHFVGRVPNYWIGHKMQTKDKEKAPRMPTGPVRVIFDMSLTSQGKPQALNVRITSGEPEDESDEDNLVDDDDGDGGGDGDPDRPRRTSPTCDTCGSTVATRLGLSVCILCGTPAPRRPMR
ncbi:unnamed protein product [Polarella glacialis]|uniref:RNA-directed DNA polymerase n=1 Tax=Polarella glacialis TaxID=89957 RepID=A0A813JI45_POLGL|nr:unnamed protein product [Polarella glacialis]